MQSFVVSNGDKTVHVHYSLLMSTSDQLADNGKHKIAIWETLESGKLREIVNPNKIAAPSPVPPIEAFTEDKADTLPPPPPPAPEVKEGEIDTSAKERIDRQQAALRAAGVTGIGHKREGGDGDQFYVNGTRMMAIGYTTQAKRAREHEAKQRFALAAEELRTRIVDEEREDVVTSTRELGRSVRCTDGRLLASGMRLSEQAIRGLLARIESPALGYVLGVRDRCFDDLKEQKERAEGERDYRRVNADRAKVAELIAYECARLDDVKIKLRTRAKNGDIYAVVGPGYTPADAPGVIPLILDAMPADARGSWSYDPDTTRWELRASIWTPTPVAEQAVGEPFEGYTTLGGKDNGTGRFKGGGGITVLRCVNASTYTAEASEVSRIHRGKVLDQIDKMVAGGLAAINVLTQAWGTNRETVVELPKGEDDAPVPLEVAIPGFWRWMLRDRRSELQGVLPGKTSTHIAELTKAYHGERRDPDRLVRADFGQAWTRYVQTQPYDVRRDAEEATGDWLRSTRALGCELRESDAK